MPESLTVRSRSQNSAGRSYHGTAKDRNGNMSSDLLSTMHKNDILADHQARDQVSRNRSQVNSQYNTQNLFAQTTELAGNNALREANSLAVKADYMNQKNHIFSQTSFNPGVQRRLDS